MNSDIRISVTLVSHHKIKKLIKVLGYESFYSLISLWSYAAINKPDGDLSCLDDIDIEIASNWEGASGLFYDTMVKFGLIDVKNDSVLIHDWANNQKWVVGSRARSESASKKVLLRWVLKELPKKQHDSFRKWYSDIYKHDTNSNTTSILALYKQYTISNTPIPLPLPIPSPESIQPEFVNFLDFWEVWPKKVNREKARLKWEKMKVTKELFSTIKKFVEMAKDTNNWKKDNGQFIPHPTTFLNGKRWEDETDIPEGDEWY